jgi:hypothetical protein
MAIVIDPTEYSLGASSKKLRILYEPSNSKKKSQVRTPLFSLLAVEDGSWQLVSFQGHQFSALLEGW